MRKFIIIVISSLISFTTLAQTSTELLNKTIAFYDPLNKWENYSCKVLLTTVGANGKSSGGEIIEIQTKEDYYKCTRIKTGVVKGIKNGECFRQIDGNNNPGQDLIKKHWVTDKNIKLSKSEHYSHIGLPMELKRSGLVLQDNVETVNIDGKAYKAISFINDSDTLNIQEWYKNLSYTLYIDDSDYSLKGYKFNGSYNGYDLYTGLMTINDIKIPICTTVFHENNSFWFVQTIANENLK